MKYIFSDEYGTPSYKGIDRDENKVFFLSAVIVDPDDYSEFILGLTDFKVRWFKHKAEFCLHFKEISKRERIYKFLNDPSKEEEFHNDLLKVIGSLRFRFVGAFIDKTHILRKYLYPVHPYIGSIQMISERLPFDEDYEYIWILESRKKSEDKFYTQSFENLRDFGLATTRLKPRNQEQLKKLRIAPLFREKRDRIAGLEIADILAYCFGNSLRKGADSDLWKYSKRIFKFVCNRRLKFHGSKWKSLGSLS
ncbi:hypothetical protein BG32_13185 [Mesotoga sp. HF07.pep.5.2.highcov]|uniref:DUF3800 domain-containing protein n=1 Tax=Mesotoga sp. HF07.pep.5.2.highcov TaxID=1462923 RepID=UPI000EF1574A|nr:DUF3800 domain-containing protein [Mesotoga sp. HF07.pep.5.2.highcov]RLL92858.1 hypothetical protein BG32_13185 [Mesotoga sp. HF07.pep.5.2.highcov]